MAKAKTEDELQSHNQSEQKRRGKKSRNKHDYYDHNVMVTHLWPEDETEGEPKNERNAKPPQSGNN